MDLPKILWVLLLLSSLGMAVPAVHAEDGGGGATTPFHLGAGDGIWISIWRDDALSRKVLVRPDGFFSFPLIGDVKAVGRTVEEVRREIEEQIREYVPDAPVTVILEELGSSKIYLVGKVNKPGEYVMNGRLRVMQALAMAGGLTPFADGKEILVVREENGRQRPYPFDYDAVVGGDGLHQNIVLKPGDTVIIP